MILRSVMLATCGCAAAIATLAFAGRPAEPEKEAVHFLELPLAAVPVVEDGRLRGLSFARLGIVGPALDEIDVATVETFMSDAFHDATLGQPGGLNAYGARTVDPGLLKAAIPIRLERAGAPFALDRIALVQSEYRSRDRLREMAKEKNR